MPQVNGKHFAYTPEGIARAKKEAAMTGERMYMNRGVSPMDRGAAPYRPMTKPRVAPARYGVAGPKPGDSMAGRGKTSADIAASFATGVNGNSGFRSTNPHMMTDSRAASSRRPHPLMMMS